MITIADIQAARDQAEAATRLPDILEATYREVSLRWRRADKPIATIRMDANLLDKIGKAIRDGNRIAALNRMEEWRAVWIKFLHQRDLTSSAKLNVIDSFRRAKTKK